MISTYRSQIQDVFYVFTFFCFSVFVCSGSCTFLDLYVCLRVCILKYFRFCVFVFVYLYTGRGSPVKGVDYTKAGGERGSRAL